MTSYSTLCRLTAFSGRHRHRHSLSYWWRRWWRCNCNQI